MDFSVADLSSRPVLHKFQKQEMPFCLLDNMKYLTILNVIYRPYKQCRFLGIA